MNRGKATEVIEAAKRELGLCVAVVAGSYRRGKETDLHDVDFLVVDEERAGDRERHEVLGELVDVVFTRQECEGPALLYLTGSKSLNIRQRVRAKRMGLKLNQYGLFDVSSGERLDDNSEEGIFECLDMNFMEPRQR